MDRIILIDDGSNDKTSEIANYLGATVLHHTQNMGVGAAMRTGTNYAKKVKPDLVVSLDGDGQHKPSDIPKIIQPILSGQADFVLGSRFLQGDPPMPLIKLAGNKLLSLLVSILTNVRVTDAQSGFRALRGEALIALNLEGNKTYVQEMIIELCLKGYKLKEVPIIVMPRKYGSSKVTSSIIKYIIKSLLTIFRAYRRTSKKI